LTTLNESSAVAKRVTTISTQATADVSIDDGVFVAAENGSLRDITNGFEATVSADACDDDGGSEDQGSNRRQRAIQGADHRRDTQDQGKQHVVQDEDG